MGEKDRCDDVLIGPGTDDAGLGTGKSDYNGHDVTTKSATENDDTDIHPDDNLHPIYDEPKKSPVRKKHSTCTGCLIAAGVVVIVVSVIFGIIGTVIDDEELSEIENSYDETVDDDDNDDNKYQTANKLLLLALKESNKGLPKDIGDGFTLINMTVVGDYVMIYYTYDERNITIAEMKALNNVNKQALLEYQKNADADEKLFLNIVLRAKKGFQYHHYGSRTGESMDTYITCDELRSAVSED